MSEIISQSNNTVTPLDGSMSTFQTEAMQQNNTEANTYEVSANEEVRRYTGMTNNSIINQGEHYHDNNHESFVQSTEHDITQLTINNNNNTNTSINTGKLREPTLVKKNINHAERRLMRDLHSLHKSVERQQAQNAKAGMEQATFGISAHPVKDNLFLWHAIISGPGNSPWEGGIFRLELEFSSQYPFSPPKIRFLTSRIFHPNVYVSGHICLDTLNSRWNPALDVEALLMSITSLLSDPNPASPANGEAASMLRDNIAEYNKRVRECVKESLMQEFSQSDCSSEDDVNSNDMNNNSNIDNSDNIHNT